jgi:hypothetical protein
MDAMALHYRYDYVVSAKDHDCTSPAGTSYHHEVHL